MMAMDDAEAGVVQEEPEDPTTYDPTQGKGTDAWQEAVRKQMEHNANLRRN